MRKNTKPAKPTPKRAPIKKKNNVVTVKAPVATGRIRRNTEPKFKVSTPGCVCLSKTEYIGEISAAGLNGAGFAVTQSYPINVGSSATFPWASALALNFESYRLKSLRFHYETECPTTVAGYVGIVLDYNALDPPPATKIAAMDFEESVRGPPWTPFTHVCLSKNLNKRKTYYCRRPDDFSFDPLLFDVGNLHVIVGSVQQDLGTLGELWVEYEVEFITPELDASSNLLNGAVHNDGDNGTAVIWSNQDDAAFAFVERGVVTWQTNTSGAYIARYASPVQNISGLKLFTFAVDTSVDDIPATAESYYGKFTSNNDALASNEPFSWFAVQPNNTYVYELILNATAGTFASITSFAINVTSNDNSVDITIVDSVIGSTVAYVRANVSVGLPSGHLQFALWPVFSGTLAIATGLTIKMKQYLQQYRAPGTGLVPTNMLGYQLKGNGNSLQVLDHLLSKPSRTERCAMTVRADPVVKVTTSEACHDSSTPSMDVLIHRPWSKGGETPMHTEEIQCRHCSSQSESK